MRSLLAVDGIRFMCTSVVANVMSFTAVGIITVAVVPAATLVRPATVMCGDQR